MLKRKPSVGANIDALCGACKVERSHVITAMDPDGTVRQVTCAYCGSRHRYRSGAATASKPTRTRRTAGSAISAATRVVRDYQRNLRYSVGELIEHPKYGRGTITEVPAPTKIRVKFPDGEHTLLQATE